MSLGDLTNDTARDATDFATEIGGGHNGLPRIPPCERQLLQDYGIPPGGAGTRSSGRSTNPICLAENFWLMEGDRNALYLIQKMKIGVLRISARFF